ncbi:preprotein translocase subunit SecE [Niameybacter massiliensis]|uniref:Protein translocase subunit SecE n=1 Tax=Holtiella tumoricola TaxID=3018743 RepID=A0AA42J1E7_9FIRM|nr:MULTISPECIES: preprotein translocase subunit SecE [Lachnospirales]MDA3732305.1 preprotein translocase subunit SecE [Holtiella tumoricola]
MVEFFKDFIAESKRIVWPNKSELIVKTANVIIFALIVAIIIFGMDAVFSYALQLLRQVV